MSDAHLCLQQLIAVFLISCFPSGVASLDESTLYNCTEVEGDMANINRAHKLHVSISLINKIKMFKTDNSGVLRVIDNVGIVNLEALIADLEKTHGQGKVSFIHKGSAVITTIETEALAELEAVFKAMGFMVSTEPRS